mgnify:CR=1 FL=1
MQREITQEMAKDRLPRREADANKGSFGSVLAAAGSMAYRGAAALCTEGALRAGAGKAAVAGDDDVAPPGQRLSAGEGVQRPAAQNDRSSQRQGAEMAHIFFQMEQKLVVSADGPAL